MRRNLIDEILSTVFFQNNPPVLFDYCTGSFLDEKWKKMGPYARCITLCNGDYDIKLLENQSLKFKQFDLFNTSPEEGEEAGNIEIYPYYSFITPYDYGIIPITRKQVGIDTDKMYEVINSEKLNSVDWLAVNLTGVEAGLFKFFEEGVIRNIKLIEFKNIVIEDMSEIQEIIKYFNYIKKNPFDLYGLNLKTVYEDDNGNEIERKVCDAVFYNSSEDILSSGRNALMMAVIFLLLGDVSRAKKILLKNSDLMNDPVMADMESKILAYNRENSRFGFLKKYTDKFF